MSRKSRVVTGIVADHFASAISIALAFLVTPIVLGYLGRATYGLWAIFGQVLGYLALTDFGITGALTTHVSRTAHQRDAHKMSVLVSTGVVAQCWIGLVFMTLGLGVAFLLPAFFDLPSGLHKVAFWAFLSAVFVRAVTFPLRSVHATLVGHQLIGIEKLIGAGTHIVTAAACILFLSLGWGLMALPASAFIATTSSTIVAMVRLRRAVPGLRVSLSLLDRSQLGGLFSFGFWWWIAGLGATIIYQTDNIVVGKLIGLEYVTVYVLTMATSYFVGQQILQMISVVRPVIGDMFGQNQESIARETLLRGLKYVFVLSGAAAAIICFFNRDIVRVWVGEQNYGGGTLTVVFACCMFLSSVYRYAVGFLFASLNPRPVALMRLSEGILNLILSVFLAVKIGLLGVGLGTLISSATTSAWFSPFQAAKLSKVCLRELIRRTVVPGLLGITGAFFSTWVMRRIWEPGGLVSVGAAVLAGGVLALPLGFLVASDHAERRWVGQIALKLSGRVREWSVALCKGATH